MTATTQDRTRQGGPPLAVPAVALAVLTVAGAVVGGGSGPRPGSSPAEVLAYLTANGGVADVGAFLLLGSAFPLVVFAATAVRRMQQLGVRAPGPLMGLAGAVLAAGAIMSSALFSWTAVQTAGLGDANLARVLATLWFATGGIGFVAPFGLCVLGVAIPALILRLVPRPLAWAGVVIGVVGLLSSVALLTDGADLLLPVGRFGGLLFLVVVSFVLPARRPVENREG